MTLDNLPSIHPKTLEKIAESGVLVGDTKDLRDEATSYLDKNDPLKRIIGLFAQDSKEPDKLYRAIYTVLMILDTQLKDRDSRESNGSDNSSRSEPVSKSNKKNNLFPYIPKMDEGTFEVYFQDIFRDKKRYEEFIRKAFEYIGNNISLDKFVADTAIKYDQKGKRPHILETVLYTTYHILGLVNAHLEIEDLEKRFGEKND